MKNKQSFTKWDKLENLPNWVLFVNILPYGTTYLPNGTYISRINGLNYGFMANNNSIYKYKNVLTTSYHVYESGEHTSS